jgi:hypothetical protein
MSLEISVGISGRTSDTDSAESLRIEDMMDMFDSPLNGRWFVSISWNKMPSEKMSDR